MSCQLWAVWLQCLVNTIHRLVATQFSQIMYYGGREGHCRGGQGRCGPPALKAAVGCQRVAHQLWLAAAAQLRPPICLKIDSLAYEWLTRLLSRTHAQGVSLSVCLCHRQHDMHSHLGTVGYNGDKLQQRNGLGLVWIRLILATGAKMLAGHAY